MSLWAVILAGGSGTRFWPLSTPTNPKQFLPLAGDRPLIVQSVDRLAGLIPVENTIIVTGERYRDRTMELLPALPAANILGEPRPRSTGPALSWATHQILRRDPEATIVSLHSDWLVKEPGRFRESCREAAETARKHEVLVTVGITPTRPDVGYGYIVPGEPLDEIARSVARFVEKPAEDTARKLIDSGALWNSGMFAWTATHFLEETGKLAPEIAPHLELLDGGDVTGFFDRVTPVAVDVSHFERSSSVAVVEGEFGWDDIGTWSALARLGGQAPGTNFQHGRVITVDSDSCVAWSDSDQIVLNGVSDLVVVRANGITFVSHRSRSARLKELLDKLPEDLREPGE